MAADAALVEGGRLQPACASFVRLADPGQPLRGVLLLLHGWTAGPFQFAELAPHYAAAGYHCYAARLPGHGARRADGGEDGSGLPLRQQTDVYATWATAAYGEAAAWATALGVPLSVFGFSMGGALALDVCARHPGQTQRLILVAPLLRPRGWRPRLVFALLRGLDALGLAGWMDRRPFGWGARPAVPPGGWVRPGHWDFWLGSLFAVLAYARGIARQTRALSVPTQLILSDSDATVDAVASLRLLASSPGQHYVWRFPRSMQVPHAMLTAGENPHAGSRATIAAITTTFLRDGTGRDGTATLP